MNPLEKMSRARWVRVVQTSRGEVRPFDELPESVRRNMMEDDRTALLALARADLPDDVFTRASGELTSDDFDRIGHGEAEAVFRAMCRAIAESGR